VPVGSLLLFLALLILVALFVARPLLDQDSAQPTEDASAPWIAERERVLDALAELDADWQLGKVPKDAYEQQREQLLAKGVVALVQIDKLHKQSSSKHTGDSDDELEVLIAAYKRKRRK
jgi:hypothetical protein